MGLELLPCGGCQALLLMMIALGFCCPGNGSLGPTALRHMKSQTTNAFNFFWQVPLRRIEHQLTNTGQQAPLKWPHFKRSCTSGRGESLVTTIKQQRSVFVVVAKPTVSHIHVYQRPEWLICSLLALCLVARVPSCFTTANDYKSSTDFATCLAYQTTAIGPLGTLVLYFDTAYMGPRTARQ